MKSSAVEKRPSFLDRPLSEWLPLRVEVALFVLILLLVAFTRFYHLGQRPMSHDESLHTYFSWNLYKGNGYQHAPMMHGPLQFHLIALSFFLFGDNDFTARVPHALAAILAVALLWLWRRYLGRAGALIAAGLMLISPFMLYYGRYARNEALIMPLAVLLWWSTLRYLESGDKRYLTWFTVATVLHFIAKETAFIYAAQMLLYLAWRLLRQVERQPWAHPEHQQRFWGALMAVAVGAVMAVVAALLFQASVAPPAPENAATPEAAKQGLLHLLLANPMAVLFLALAGVAAIAAVYFLVVGVGWQQLRQNRAFGLLLLLSTFVLPQLTPLPMALVHWNAQDYSVAGLVRTALFLIPMLGLSIALGLAWDANAWLKQAALFYGIFTVFQTTVFTNAVGFFSGLVGALAYWLSQQGVHRGDQPWFYYLLTQIPIYTYLPALGTLVAGVAWLWRGGKKEAQPEAAALETSPERLAAGFLLFWSLTSVLAYTLAGEKMPWLTVHIALPMILLTGWLLGRWVDRMDWETFRSEHGWALVGLVFMFVLATAEAVGAWLGPQLPFHGSELAQLESTASFLVGTVVAILSGLGIVWLSMRWRTEDLLRLAGLTFFGLLALLTTHTAVQAAYYNAGQANEYLVYAHSADGVRIVMSQVHDLSLRLTDGLGLQVAYDDAISWPFTWYLRNYPNQRFYGSSPTPDMKTLPVILVGAANYGKVEPIVARNFVEFEYVRMVWPNQDYFGLTWDKVKEGLRNPKMRAALFQIWLNRDFTLYFRLKNGVADDPAAAAKINMATILKDWTPADRMRMYVRKDIVAQIWNYGAAPVTQGEEDPYAKKQAVLAADKVLGAAGQQPGQFQGPRGIAVAADGSLYVADTRNHRIQHLTADGKVLQVWGAFGNLADGAEAAPGGTFNEPWGVAVGPDGSVYVADTWNHRIQKFTADGKFLTMWGKFGNDGQPTSLWGPRDVAVDAAGHVFVTDTGNKRIVIFDANGQPLGTFGSVGADVGQFDEPVGLALDGQGHLYVADTWNQRVQVFTVNDDLTFTPLRQWDVYGWYGQSLDNKPYLAADAQGHVFVGDPEGYRILEFNAAGQLLRWWGTWGPPPDGLGLVGGLAVDGQGGLWVADAEHGQILHFLPEQARPAPAP